MAKSQIPINARTPITICAEGLFVVAAAALMATSCSKSNNVVLGRVTMQLADHTVVVTDCYRTSVPRPDTAKSRDGAPLRPSDAPLHWAPCRDADITIRDGTVVVNGRTYGPLKKGDSVMVDHGKVLIDGEKAEQK